MENIKKLSLEIKNKNKELKQNYYELAKKCSQIGLETFLPIPDATKYQISNLGRIRNKYKILKIQYDKDNYHMVHIGKTNKRIHRLVMKTFSTDFNENLCVDHINHDVENNKLYNLRMCTRSQNNMNMKPFSHKLIPKGVTYHKPSKKYRAKITFNRQQFHLGFYKKMKDAHKAYKNKAILLFGEFACFK